MHTQHGILTLTITVDNDSVTSIDKTHHPLPSGFSRNPEATLDTPVRIVDTESPPATSLFAARHAQPDRALKAAHDLFGELVVMEALHRKFPVPRYLELFRYWLRHYTTLDPPPDDDDLAAVVSYRRDPGNPRLKPDDEPFYYRGIRLDTSPFIVHVGDWRPQS
jgi:hypothetical protein